MPGVDPSVAAVDVFCGSSTEFSRGRELNLGCSDGVQQGKLGSHDIKHDEPTLGRREDRLPFSAGERQRMYPVGGEAEQGEGIAEGVVWKHQQWKLRAKIGGLCR